MKTNKLIESVAFLALTIVAGCGLEIGAANSSNDPNDADSQIRKEETMGENTTTISAYKLLAEKIPTDDVILAQVLKLYAENQADGTSAGIAPETAKLSTQSAQSLYKYMRVFWKFEIFDGVTGVLQGENDPLDVGDLGIIRFKIYYEELGASPIRIEGVLSLEMTWDGSDFVDEAYTFDVQAVTSLFSGKVYNIARFILDPTDPLAAIAGATVKFSTTDSLLGDVVSLATTDDSGVYQAAVFDGYDYLAEAFAGHFSPNAPQAVTAVAGETVTVNFFMEPSATGDVLIGTNSLSGRVLDLDGNPVAGAFVEARDVVTGELALSTTGVNTDANGEWTLLLPPMSQIELRAYYGAVYTSVTIDYPAAGPVDLTLPLGLPRCVSLYAMSLVYTGGQSIVDLEVENPMNDSLFYIFNEIDQNKMILTAGSSILWTAPSTPGVYRILAVAKNGYGECSLEIGITVENEIN